MTGQDANGAATAASATVPTSTDVTSWATNCRTKRMIQIQTRIKFTRLGHPGMNKPSDIILKGNADDDTIVGAIKEEGRKRYASSNVRLVKGAGNNMSLAFYVEGGKLGEGTITREWP